MESLKRVIELNPIKIGCKKLIPNTIRVINVINNEIVIEIKGDHDEI